MIKTVFVPLMLKAFPIGESQQVAQRKLSESMNAALQQLDSALDDGWRILDKQYIDSSSDSGVVFFLRDDAECLIITDEGLAALEDLDPPVCEECQGSGYTHRDQPCEYCGGSGFARPDDDLPVGESDPVKFPF